MKKSGNACYHSVQNFLSSSLISKSVKMKIYGDVILPVVLSGYEAWSFTLRVTENRVLRKIFWHKNDEVTWQWVRLHNEEFYDVLLSPNVIRVISLGRACGTCGWHERCIQGFGGGGAEERRQLGRPKRSWEDNIKMDLREVGCGGIDWIDLAQDTYRWLALVNAVMNLRVP